MQTTHLTPEQALDMLESALLDIRQGHTGPEYRAALALAYKDAEKHHLVDTLLPSDLELLQQYGAMMWEGAE